MSIQLNPGFTGMIEVKNSKGISLYEKNCSSAQQVKEFVMTYSKSKPGWSLLRGAACPLRTNNAKDFAKDFFLPTFVNFSLKVNNVALKVFASIFAIGFDIITFPIRLITSGFRAIYNYYNPEKKHPLLSLIEGENEGASIKGDILSIRYGSEDVKFEEPTREDGHIFQYAQKSFERGTVRVALKRLPGVYKHQETGKSGSYTYYGIDGEWTLEGRSTSKLELSAFAC